MVLLIPDGSARNIKLVVEYDGSDYAGFQVQTKQPVRTIQGVLEEAILEICGESVRITAAGRTDAGVHGRGQVINFFTKTSIETQRLPAALNSALPRDIVIVDAKRVPDGFHARYDALTKVYEYTVLNRAYRSPFWERYSYFVSKPLQRENVYHAAQHCIGTHDFTSFKASGSSVKTSIRTVRHFDIAWEPPLLRFRIEADGFLYNMVRIIVGTLLEVGRGSLAPADVQGILAAKDRNAAGPTAPPHGLCLLEVKYPQDAVES